MRWDRAAPARLGQRIVAARPRPPVAGHRSGVHLGRTRAGRPAAVRHLPRQGLDRGQRGPVARPRPDRVLSRGRRGRAAGGRRRVLRPRRPAVRGHADGQGGRRGDQRNDRRQGPHPAHHDRPARDPGGGGHRRGPHRPARARGPGRGGPLRGPGRVQHDRAVRRARLSPGGAVRRRAHQRDGRRRADRPRLGRRGADPGLAGAVLAAPAAAARSPAERLDRRGRPPLPERRGQRLRDVDRHRPGGPRRHLRCDHRLTPEPCFRQ